MARTPDSSLSAWRRSLVGVTVALALRAADDDQGPTREPIRRRNADGEQRFDAWAAQTGRVLGGPRETGRRGRPPRLGPGSQDQRHAKQAA